MVVSTGYTHTNIHTHHKTDLRVFARRGADLHEARVAHVLQQTRLSACACDGVTER